MICPFCQFDGSKVIRTWPKFESKISNCHSKRRKRKCEGCRKFYFTNEVYASDFRKLDITLTESKINLLRTPLEAKE